MEGIYGLKEKLQGIYAEHSIKIEKSIQFVVALIAFLQINKNIGFFKMASSPAIALGLAVICAFFPPFMTVLVATLLILAHMYGVSLGVLAVTGVIFVIMYVFYLRLAPKMGMAILLSALAFVFKVPFVVPMAYALLSTPSAIIAIMCGTFTYYMLGYVKGIAPAFTGDEAPGLLEQVTTVSREVFEVKEMWCVMFAFVIAFLLVYTIRRQSINHSWKIAAVAGAIVNILISVGGSTVLGVEGNMGTIFTGSIVAVVVALVLEVLFFAVDYSRSENLQYEDDEYYYYVKAVPKFQVAIPEKKVKRINKRDESKILDTDEVRRKKNQRKTRKPQTEKEINEQLLKKSLKEKY